MVIFFLLGGGKVFSLSEETLIYRIKYLLFSAGEQVLKIKEGGGSSPSLVISSRTRSYGLVALFYPLDDRVITRVDKETLEPLEIEMWLKEGRFRDRRRIKVDRERRICTIEDLGKGKKKEFSFSPPAFDLLSLIYWVRKKNLKVGDWLEISLINRKKIKKVKVEVTKKEKVETYTGTYEAFLYEAGDPEGEEKIRVWISEKERIPVKVQVPTEAGMVVGVLFRREVGND